MSVYMTNTYTAPSLEVHLRVTLTQVIIFEYLELVENEINSWLISSFSDMLDLVTTVCGDIETAATTSFTLGGVNDGFSGSDPPTVITPQLKIMDIAGGSWDILANQGGLNLSPGPYWKIKLTGGKP